jgi:hypothetical protein
VLMLYSKFRRRMPKAMPPNLPIGALPSAEPHKDFSNLGSHCNLGRRICKVYRERSRNLAPPLADAKAFRDFLAPGESGWESGHGAHLEKRDS